jgi:ABC-type Fe3+ transport system substrate-binding protein
MKRRRVVPLLCLFLYASVTILFCSTANSGPPGFGNSFEEVVRLAKKEGKVRVGFTLDEAKFKIVSEGFRKRYPMIRVEFTPNVTSGASERISLEALAGRVEYDLMNVDDDKFAHFSKMGVIVGPLEWHKIFRGEIPKEHVSPDGHYIVASFNLRAIAYNQGLVSREKVPKKWEDCLDPYWKGNFAVHIRAHPFVNIWSYWGETKTMDYVTRLKDNQPVWSRGMEDALIQLASGEVRMVCGINYHFVHTLKKQDPRTSVAVVFPDAVPVALGDTIGIVKGAENPNAAFLLAGWLASLEGQVGFDEIGKASPFLEGSEIGKALRKAGAKPIFVGWDESNYTAERRNKILSVLGFRPKKN